MSTNLHSLIPPSSASRRMACPGSRKLEAISRKSESEKSRLGTEAHAYLERFLVEHFWTKNLKVEDKANPDFLKGAKLFHKALWDEVFCFVSDENPLDKTRYAYGIEERVDCPRIHFESWGTVDTWVYCYDTQRLFVFDYKFGNAFVEVEENWQLLTYASGLITKLVSEGLNVIEVSLVIVQPNCFRPYSSCRRWDISYSEFLVYEERLRVSEERSMEEDSPCVPTIECKYCSARSICVSLQRAAFEMLEPATESFGYELTGHELGAELRFLEYYKKFLDARISGLQDEAIARIKEGQGVSHYQVKSTRGRLEWTTPLEELIAYAQITGRNDLIKQNFVTPTQALSAGVDSQFVNKHSDRPYCEPKLTMVSQKDIASAFNIYDN